MDFAVVFYVERSVLRVEIFRGHGEREIVFFRLETHGVVTALRVDHALGEGSAVNQLVERGSVVTVLFVEHYLSAHDDAHVAEGGSFGGGTRRISVELGGVPGGLRRGVLSA